MIAQCMDSPICGPTSFYETGLLSLLYPQTGYHVFALLLVRVETIELVPYFLIDAFAFLIQIW